MSIDSDPLVNYAAITFENGLTGIISSTGGYDVVLACSQGIVTVDSDGHGLSYRLAEQDDIYWREKHDVPNAANEPAAGTYAAVSCLVDALRNRGSHSAAVARRDMLLGQRVLFALVQSQLCGQPVGLNDIDSRLVVTGRAGQFYP